MNLSIGDRCFRLTSWTTHHWTTSRVSDNSFNNGHRRCVAQNFVDLVHANQDGRREVIPLAEEGSIGEPMSLVEVPDRRFDVSRCAGPRVNSKLVFVSQDLESGSSV